MSRILFLDFETASTVDLNKTGAEVYAESPHTRALMMAWAFDRYDVRGALFDDLAWMARDALDHVRGGGRVVAHNAPFELAIWNMLHEREPDVWPELHPEQTYCTMAQCRVLSLPGSLDKAATALRLPFQKDKDGHRLMLKMCKPRKPRKNESQDTIFWDHHTPENLARLLQYCKEDVAPEREIYYLLPQLSARERAYWLIDRRINARGIGLDVDGVRVCAAATAKAQDELKAELQTLTGGYVTSANAHKAFREWLAACGCELPNLQRGTVENALERTDLLPEVRRALQIRQYASKASVAKLEAMLAGVCKDGRARGLLEYHGTSTGRPAGRRIQPTNMLRPPESFTVGDAEDILDWLRREKGERVVSAQYSSVINGVAYSMRSLIKATPGKRLLAADYANIEGRGLAWLAGEDWKLEAFRKFDAGIGHDLYKLAFAASFGVKPEDVTKDQRQIGKVQELALGYQGGHGAFISMAKNYNIDLVKMAAAVKMAVSPRVWEDALFLYWKGARETAEEILAHRQIEARLVVEAGDEPNPYEPDLFDLMSELAKVNRFGLTPDVWAAIRIIVDGWRQAHPATVWFWRGLEDASINAVLNPGTITRAGRIEYLKTGDFLMCKLPSGRKIAYPYPRVETDTDRPNSNYRRHKLVFEGIDSKTRKWRVQHAYGGFLGENGTQATARCIQSDSHHRLEAAGYELVLHVYDENVCEMPYGQGSLEEMSAIMSASESWARGLPIAVSGWEGERYRK